LLNRKRYKIEEKKKKKMDVEVKTEYLRKVVSCTSRATSNKTVQPILNNLLIASENGSIVVSATDLDLAIECKLPANVTKPGKITIPAKKLDEIVGKVSGDEVSISNDKNNLTRILSNRSKYQINGIPPEDFPEIIKKPKKEEKHTIKQEELLRAISLTAFASSKFENTSILSGINFEIKGENFEIAATDGSRLARYIGKLCKNPTKEKEETNQTVIPWRAFTELEKLTASFKEGNEEVSFYYLPGQIIFTNNDFSLSTRLLSGTFPTYDKLIPKK